MDVDAASRDTNYHVWLERVSGEFANAILVGYYESIYSWEKAFNRGLTPKQAVKEMWDKLNANT